MIIAISGKGGTGKTLFASVLVNRLKKRGHVLAVDADPDANLGQCLGVKGFKTVGELREGIIKHPKSVPPSMDKKMYLEYLIHQNLQEVDGFDLLVMGRPEGSGCYCAINHILRDVISNLKKNYDYVVVDTEAGLEHFSRQCPSDMDILVLMSDGSKMAEKTNKEIIKICKAIGLRYKVLVEIINRVKGEVGKGLVIKEDEEVYRLNLEGKPVANIKGQVLDTIERFVRDYIEVD